MTMLFLSSATLDFFKFLELLLHAVDARVASLRVVSLAVEGTSNTRNTEISSIIFQVLLEGRK